MTDDYRLRGYPRDEKLDWQTWQLQRLIVQLRTEGWWRIADRIEAIVQSDPQGVKEKK